MLLDEPLGALDKKLRQQTQLELVNMIEQVGVTCIMVTQRQSGRSHDHGQPGGHHVRKANCCKWPAPVKILRAAQLPLHR